MKKVDVMKSETPNGCIEEEFGLVKLYLLFKTGAALNKQSVERVLNHKMSDTEMKTIRNSIEKICNRKLTKRKDNSYEMR